MSLGLGIKLTTSKSIPTSSLCKALRMWYSVLLLLQARHFGNYQEKAAGQGGGIAGP